MIRPLSFYDHTDPQTWYRQDEFMFGDHLLVCPVLEPDRLGRRIYLPKGDWYHYYSDTLFEGGKEIFLETSLEEIPLMVKAGAIIPMSPVKQHVENTLDALDLHVYRGTESVESMLYDDSGDGYNHKQGYYVNRNFTVLPNGEKYRITQYKEGRMPSSVKEIRLVYHGFEKLPTSVELNSNVYEVNIDTQENTFSFKVPEDFKQITLRWG